MTNLIGKNITGFSHKYNKNVLFVCTGVDPDNIYLMNVNDPEDCKNCSPNAIGRTNFVMHNVPYGTEGTIHV